MAALGFATVENVLYVLSGGAGVGALRAALAVPSHAFDGVVMGYFLGEAKFARSDAAGNLISALGLALAVVAHGLYDFIVFTIDKAPFMMLTLGLFVVLSWVIIFKATRRLSEQSPYKHPPLVDLHSMPPPLARAPARTRLPTRRSATELLNRFLRSKGDGPVPADHPAARSGHQPRPR